MRHEVYDTRSKSLLVGSKLTGVFGAGIERGLFRCAREARGCDDSRCTVNRVTVLLTGGGLRLDYRMRDSAS